MMLDVSEGGALIPTTGATFVPVVHGNGVERERIGTRKDAIAANKGHRRAERAAENAETAILERLVEMEGEGETNCLVDLLGDEATFTLAEIGSWLGLTRERVRQIEIRGLEKIRRLGRLNPRVAKALREFLLR